MHVRKSGLKKKKKKDPIPYDSKVSAAALYSLLQKSTHSHAVSTCKVTLWQAELETVDPRPLRRQQTQSCTTYLNTRAKIC